MENNEKDILKDNDGVFSQQDACDEIKKIKAESVYDDIITSGGKKTAYLYEGVRRELIYSKARPRAEKFLAFLEKAVSAWHAVHEGEKILKEAGFKEYGYADLKDLKQGDLGYYKKNNSLLIAFSIGRDATKKEAWKVFGGHTDSPSLKLKPHSLIKDEGIYKLNTEVYGGPILSTWFDRPLSLAGRVFVASDDPRKPKEILVDFKRPILLLPNLAIHMNREVNEGVKIERHKVLLPFLGSERLINEECFSQENFVIEGSNEAKDNGCGDDLFARMLSAELKVPTNEILDYDLICYDVSKPCLAGYAEEFILSGRLDNLTNTEIGLQAMAKTAKNTDNFSGVNILILTDNEEVGSRSKQGADSILTANFFEALASGLGISRAEYFDLLDRSFMISADVAHAVHPNYKDYADPTHRPGINGGPIIKVAASQSYASDAQSQSVFASICREAGVPYDYFVNRSDLRGGSTIGPIASAIIPIPTVDAGTPIWSMHSCRETSGVLDHYYMSEAIDTFYAM